MLNAGMTPVVMDNLYNANKEALKRVEELTSKKVEFVELDLLDECGARVLCPHVGLRGGHLNPHHLLV
jgi:UDP-glucose 4-epimerase